MLVSPPDHKAVVAAFAKRLGRRGANVSKTADYVCALERAIECAETVFAKNPSQLFEMDSMPATVVDGCIALVRDAADNYAVLWYHGGCRDLLVSLTPGFGEPVAIQSLGLIREDQPDADPQAWGQFAQRAGAEPVDFAGEGGTTYGDPLTIQELAKRATR